MRTNQSCEAGRSSRVGVASAFWRAGKSVNTVIHVKTSPTATHMPISRIGRMGETARAANPVAVAKIDAVHATNLFESAKIWCASTEWPAGRSINREWMYTSVAVAVTRMVIGTIGETIV